MSGSYQNKIAKAMSPGFFILSKSENLNVHLMF